MTMNPYKWRIKEIEEGTDANEWKYKWENEKNNTINTI